MSDPRGRALPNLISLYLVMLVIYCLDVFFLESDLTVLGDNFYSRFLCFVVLFMLVLFKKEHIKNFGISTKKEKLKDALIYGTFFSVVPLFIASAAEYIIFKFVNPDVVNTSFNPPSLSYVRGYMTPAVCIIIYIFTTLFSACFKEMFFRGILLHKLEKLTTFKGANAFQALLYTSFIIPKLIRNFAMGYYGEEIVELALFVVIFYLVHEFISGIKWGLLAKASGATYISIVDNFLYVFFANSVRIADQNLKWLFMIHMICTQLISLALVYFYYKKKNTTKESAEKEEAKAPEIKSKKSKKVEEKNTTTNIEPEETQKGYSAEIIPDTEAISPNEFKDIVSTNSSEKHKIKAHNGELPEEEIDEFLKDYGKPKHHYHPPEKSNLNDKSIDDNFDVDDFLKKISNH